MAKTRLDAPLQSGSWGTYTSSGFCLPFAGLRGMGHLSPGLSLLCLWPCPPGVVPTLLLGENGRQSQRGREGPW